MNTYLMQLSGDVPCFKAVTPETRDDAVTDGLKHYDAVIEIEVAGNRVQRIRHHTKEKAREPEPMNALRDLVGTNNARRLVDRLKADLKTDRTLELLERIALALEARK